MKPKSRTAVALLVTCMALAVCGVSSASAALPEFTTNPGSFKGTLGGTLFGEIGLREWKYTSNSFEGLIPSKTTVSNVNIFFKGNEGCNNTAEGLTWEGVKGRLGYINKTKQEVGLLLGEPVSQPIASCEFKRGPEFEKYSGTLIARITPVNTKTNKFHLYLGIKEGKQEVRKFEGGQEWPLLFGTYSCSKFLEKEVCSSSSTKKVEVESPEIWLTTPTETEIKA